MLRMKRIAILNSNSNDIILDYGLFIVFNTQENKVVFEKQIEDLVKLYENEEKIFVLGINCL